MAKLDQLEAKSPIIAPVRTKCEGFCNAHNIMGDISEVKRGQIVDASLCDVSRVTVSRVMLVNHQEE